MGAAATRASVGALGRESPSFPSRRTLPRGLCQIVSPNPFLLGRATFSGPLERWPVQPLCLQRSDAAGNLIWVDQGGLPHGAQAVSTLISQRLNTAGPPALLSPAVRLPAQGGPSFWAGKHQLGNAAWGASFPSERALPAGGFGSVHTPSP